MSTRTTEFAAQITGDANGAIAALEKVKARVQDTAKATESANQKVASSTGLLIKESEKAAKGFAAITQALYAMEAEGSARVLALGSAVGNFADLLGPGGKVVSGIAIVASSIVALFLQAKEKSAEAKKAIEDDIKSLINAGDFAKITKRLQEIEQGTAGEGFQDGRSAIRERIAQLREEASAVGKSSRFYRERQEAIIAEQRKLNELNAEYDRYYKALTDPRNSPSAPRGLAGQPIVATADSTDKTARDAKKLADEYNKAAKAFDDAFAASLLATQAAIAEADRALEERQFKLQDSLDKESAQRRENNTELRKEADALLQGAEAYEAYLTAQAQSQAVAEAERRAKEAGVQLTVDQVNAIKDEVAQRIKLNKLVEALKSLNGQNPFSLPTEEDFKKVGQLADNFSKAAAAASGISAAFGEAGQRMASILAQSAALLTNLNRAQRAGIFTDAAGKQQNVGVGGALRGEAGASGRVDAILGIAGAVGAGVGVVNSFISATQRAAEQATAAAIALRELGASARAAVKEYSLEAGGTPLERELAGLENQFRGIIRNLLAAGAPATDRLGRRGAVSTRPTAADVDAAIDAYEKLVEAAKRAAEFEARQSELTNEARLLEAQGRTAEAAALRQLAADEKELEEARLRGADTAKLVAIQEAEAAQRELNRQRQQQKIRDDVAARRATLGGDERGAFVIGQQSFAAQAIAEAEALFAAGTITAELFEQLKEVIGEELADAISDFDEAAALAAQRVQEDIAVRTLEAQGRGAEAEALRRQFKNQEELRNAADDTVRAQLENLQLLEAQALAAAEALQEAEDARAATRENAGNRIELFDLEGVGAVNETLAGYGEAFSGLFKQFDLTTLDGINGAKGVLRGIFTEIQGLSDDEILRKFGMTREELVGALLDADAGFDSLAQSLNSAASEAANFAEQIGTEFLRSTGRGREADIAAAQSRRDSRIKQAKQLGLDDSVIAQIESIYQADVAEINARYANAGAAAASAASSASASIADAPRQARAGNGGVRQEFGALAEVTGQTLAGLLREVAINTGRSGAIVEALLGRGPAPSLAGLTFPSFSPGGSSGAGVVFGTVNITIGSLNPMGMTPTEAATAVSQEIGREIGRVMSAEIQFLGDARR